jgi:DNA-directed RNA polymerase subunit RPC12/RpoP
MANHGRATWARLATNLPEGEAAVIAGRLQAEGIPVTVETMAAGLGSGPMSTLLVPSKRLRAARAIVETHDTDIGAQQDADHGDSESAGQAAARRVGAHRTAYWIGVLIVVGAVVMLRSGRAAAVAALGVGFLLMVGSLLAVAQVRCPRCGYRLFRPAASWQLVSQRQCAHCGYKLP